MAGELSGRSYNAGLSLERRLGSLSAFIRPVEVGIEADQDQVVFFGGHILIGVVEVETESLHSIDDRLCVLRRQMDEGRRTFEKRILHEVQQGPGLAQSGENQTDGVE